MPPALPSVSARALTVMTSLYEAGTRFEALPLSLAAAATTVMPPATTRQIALWRMSSFTAPHAWSSEPHLVTLMFTASMSGRVESFGSRWRRIQSRPQTYQDSRP